MKYTAVLTDGEEVALTCGGDDDLWIAVSEQIEAYGDAGVDYVIDESGEPVDY